MSVALTFDDGPNHSTTLQLLDYLEAEHVRATFFVLGNMVQKFPAVLKRIANSPVGHQIGNHSLSHADFMTLNDAAIEKEITTTQKIIEDTVGATFVRIMRPPLRINYKGSESADPGNGIPGRPLERRFVRYQKELSAKAGTNRKSDHHTDTSRQHRPCARHSSVHGRRDQDRHSRTQATKLFLCYSAAVEYVTCRRRGHVLKGKRTYAPFFAVRAGTRGCAYLCDTWLSGGTHPAKI